MWSYWQKKVFQKEYKVCRRGGRETEEDTQVYVLLKLDKLISSMFLFCFSFDCYLLTLWTYCPVELIIVPYAFSSSNITPFVQPNPDCTTYSPPPPYLPACTASYCEQRGKEYWNTYLQGYAVAYCRQRYKEYSNSYHPGSQYHIVYTDTQQYRSAYLPGYTVSHCKKYVNKKERERHLPGYCQ